MAHQDGVIVTNFHVVVAFGQMETVGVMTDGGQVFLVKKVLAANKRDDVAVLKIEAHDLKPLPMTSPGTGGDHRLLSLPSGAELAKDGKRLLCVHPRNRERQVSDTAPAATRR